MKNNRFLSLLFLILFVSASSAVFKPGDAAGQSLTAAKAEKIDKEQLAGMIKPTLEKYLTNHPDPQVRIWSMVLLVNMDKIDEEQVSSIPTLVLQLGNKDENIRQIALNSIRGALDLDESEWKGIMGTVFRTIAKTTKYPEVKKAAVQSLGMMQDLDEESLDSLTLLFDLAQDSDPEIRQMANENIVKVLASKEAGSGGGGGGGDFAGP